MKGKYNRLKRVRINDRSFLFMLKQSFKGKAFSSKQISEKVRVDHTNLKRRLNILEANGFIEDVTHRMKGIALNAKGLPKYQWYVVNAKWSQQIIIDFLMAYSQV